ncbi:MAG: flagellar biosynthesis protein FlhB [Helicobacteraceae bacterium]|nr:flagellar biosynthesis protein FlhB [Helicobacteraceae bacterium]
MSAETDGRTEKPTSKKISKARQKGNVPKSQDVSAFVTLTIAFASIVMLYTLMRDYTMNIVYYYFSILGRPLTQNNIIEILLATIEATLIIILPLSLIIMAAGVYSNIAQFGWNFTTEPLGFKFSKLNPVSGLKNLFSAKKLVEGVKITFKSLGSLAIASMFFWDFILQLPIVALMTFSDQIDWLIESAAYLVAVMLFIMMVFAIIDFYITRYQYEQSNMMTKQEVKDEVKGSEGNPEIKAKIRQRQMEMHQQRMMSNVPSADVVITNPTHYAVALKYDQEKHRAPVVVAKGADNIALKIKEIARENDVTIVQNPPLARSLYEEVELDHPIPEALFKAVVDVLAFVYKAKGNKN